MGELTETYEFWYALSWVIILASVYLPLFPTQLALLIVVGYTSPSMAKARGVIKETWGLDDVVGFFIITAIMLVFAVYVVVNSFTQLSWLRLLAVGVLVDVFTVKLNVLSMPLRLPAKINIPFMGGAAKLVDLIKGVFALIVVLIIVPMPYAGIIGVVVVSAAVVSLPVPVVTIVLVMLKVLLESLY